jgi:hypothetical protein
MHELFEELDAFDERWRLKYSTLYDAAVAAGAEGLYGLYIASTAGQKHRDEIAAPNYVHEDQRQLED